MADDVLYGCIVLHSLYCDIIIKNTRLIIDIDRVLVVRGGSMGVAQRKAIA